MMKALIKEENEPVFEQVSMFDESTDINLLIPDTDIKEKVFKRKYRTGKKLRDVQFDILDIFECPKHAPNRDDYDEQEIQTLRAWMFQRHMKYLCDERTEPELVYDVLDWIMDDEIHPFCFRICVDVARETPTEVGEWLSLSNIHTLRKQLLGNIKRLRKDLDLSRYQIDFD